MIEPTKVNKQHDLHMRSRKQIELTGVQNVESFDSEEFLLSTELGEPDHSGDSFTYQEFKSGEWNAVP